MEQMQEAGREPDHRLMRNPRAVEIADILRRELGSGATRYAERIAYRPGPLAADYAEAAAILREDARS